MDQKIKRYYQLKEKQKEIEKELKELRSEITDYCEEHGLSELTSGNYKVKVVFQERREYDDQKLYAALPDPEVWRMLSKPDPARITSLLKLNVITENTLKETFSVKRIPLLHIDKK